MNSFDLTGVVHHPVITQLTDLLCNQTQNQDRGFFHVEVAYFAAKVASTMGATMLTKDRGEIPVNLYALLLATSGYGKGHSIYVMEQEILSGFKKTFVEDTLPVIAEQNLWVLGQEKAIKNQSDEQEEKEKIEKEYKSYGTYPFTFDSGTVPAVKQLRQKLLISKAGSINLQIDEIGSNLLGNAELLNLFLELYDQGMVKPKLTKNTAENVRGEELEGRTPANLLMFGTPSKLFDGGSTEDHFYSFLETGYGRRCLFGMGVVTDPDHQPDAEEIYKRLINPSNSQAIRYWNQKFEALADVDLFGWQIDVPYNVGVKLMEYKLSCEAYARDLPDHDEIKKAEISHRYFRALKLAGTYAFVDQAAEIDIEEHLLPAILLVQESGESFQKILNREKPYVRLAKFIASVDGEVTHVDIMETNPSYTRSGAQRSELINLATAWGYKNHIIIKKTYSDNVEFFSGKTLKETDLNELTLSWSDDYAYNYLNETASFADLHQLTAAQGLHFLNHQLVGGDLDPPQGHRHDKNIIAGFDMIVIDVDGTCSVDTFRALMSNYKYLLYTTKSHVEDGEHRFRAIFPINYHLELDQEEYKKFMNAFMDWLPFESDRGANQRARKWETCSSGNYEYNMDGEVMDALDFIPQTSRNEEHKKTRQKLTSMDKLEGWFAAKIQDGNRNNMMLRFAMALVDGGMGYDEVAGRTSDFNKKLPEPLDENELLRTVLVSVAKKYDEQP